MTAIRQHSVQMLRHNDIVFVPVTACTSYSSPERSAKPASNEACEIGKRKIVEPYQEYLWDPAKTCA
jgi:uncharacterized protein (UPF0262 family)